MFDLLIKSVKTGGKDVEDMMIHRIGVILAGSDCLDAAFEGFKTLMKSVWGWRELDKIYHSGFVSCGRFLGRRSRWGGRSGRVIISKSSKWICSFIVFELGRLLDGVFVSSRRWHGENKKEGERGKYKENTLLIPC